MNIHVRLVLTDGEFGHLVQISTDNLTWIPIKSFKALDPAMEFAKSFEASINESWKIKVKHVLWRTKT